MTETTDVVIVGGGSTGTSTALHLARLGVRVVLVEKNLIGSGQSGHAAGIARTHTPVIEAARAAKESLDFFQNFKETVGEDIPFHRVGYLVIFPREVKDLVTEHAARLESIGSYSHVIGEDEARAIFPPMECREPATYLFEAAAGYIDPMAVTRALADAAIREGVQVCEGVQVNSLNVTNGQVSGVVTTGGVINSAKVFLATGVWTNTLLRDLHAQIAVYPHRTEAIFLRRPPAEHGDHPVIDDKHNLVYYRPQGRDQSYVGYLEAMRHPDRDSLDRGDPDNLRQGNTLETVRDLHERVSRRVPAYRKGYWKSGFACVYDVTEDWLPTFDEIESAGGLFVASGFSGGGFHLAPWIGRTMAEYISSGEKPKELEPFANGRFRDRTLITGVYPFAR